MQPIGEVINGRQVQFGESLFPCDRKEDYEKSVKCAIKAIYSDSFEKLLEQHIKDSIGEGAHVAAWNGVNSHDVVKKMRDNLNGTTMETYGGIKGWWLYRVYGNQAYDGTEKGPILVNRIPLKYRNSASIANTIAHEIAHRIGLTHPHSSMHQLKIAYKEPPYIIGDIIQEIVEKEVCK